ncbi:MAG: radical SAM protein [Dehalococcoidia bacterium]|jgi:putative pyruvate formate lyase activating enzyme
MAAYLELYHSGKLAERVEAARALLKNCRLCPRHCGINRLVNEKGQCYTGKLAVISSYGPHFGEEAPLVGTCGSGTIFFTNCNLKCLFCQNYSISQLGDGNEITKEELAKIMVTLQDKGCHNINLVSPTHVVPQILEALEIAINLGLRLPLVYNSGGYDASETLEILDGIVDIYMPDMKYDDEKTAEELSGIKNYPSINRTALKEMYRQVGDLRLNEDGIAVRGILIRHLVLPNELAGTKEIMKFIAEEISPNSYVNVMSQYHPCYKAFSIRQLNRSLSKQEFLEAVNAAARTRLNRLDRMSDYCQSDLIRAIK